MSEFCYCLAWEWINISLEYTAAAWLKLPRFLLAAVAVNLLTHPAFTYLLWRFGNDARLVCVSEAVILAVEATALTLLYGRARWRRTTLAALIMNATSFATGLLLTA